MKHIARMSLLSFAFLVAACNGSNTITDYEDGDEFSSASSAVMMEESSSAMSDEASSPTALVPEGRVITMSVTDFAFAPNSITVKSGENVTLQLTGVEGVHGFAVPALGIDEAVGPGETIRVTIPTDQVGTFDFFCNIPCGEGHRDMKGSIIIQA